MGTHFGLAPLTENHIAGMSMEQYQLLFIRPSRQRASQHQVLVYQITTCTRTRYQWRIALKT
jgi:hypothetical protein